MDNPQDILSRLNTRFEPLTSQFPNSQFTLFGNGQEILSFSSQEMTVPSQYPPEQVARFLGTLEGVLDNPLGLQGELSIYVGERTPENEILRVVDGAVQLDTLSILPPVQQLSTPSVPEPSVVSSLYQKYSQGLSPEIDVVTAAHEVAVNALRDNQSPLETKKILEANPHYQTLLSNNGQEIADRYAMAIVTNAQSSVIEVEPNAPVVQPDLQRFELAEKIDRLTQISQAQAETIDRLTQTLEKLIEKMEPELSTNLLPKDNPVASWLGQVRDSISQSLTEAKEAIQGYLRPVVYDGLEAAKQVAENVLGADDRLVEGLEAEDPGQTINEFESYGQEGFEIENWSELVDLLESEPTPADLWHQYSPESAPSPIAKAVAVAQNALAAGESVSTVVEIIREGDPNCTKIEPGMDGDAAEKRAQQIVNTAEINLRMQQVAASREPVVAKQKETELEATL